MYPDIPDFDDTVWGSLKVQEELYLWMKHVAFFYLFFTVFLHLVPDSSYERYIRLFMGLLLILLLCVPVAGLAGKEEEFLEEFQKLFASEETTFLADAQTDLQEQLLQTGYEEELQSEMIAALTEAGFAVEEVEVTLSAETPSIHITCTEAGSQEKEAQILEELQSRWQLTDDTAEILLDFHDPAAVDRAASVGNASDRDRTSSVGS